MVEHQITNLGSGVTYRPPDTDGYPGCGGVIFSKDPGQLESSSVSVDMTGPDRQEGTGTDRMECDRTGLKKLLKNK